MMPSLSLLKARIKLPYKFGLSIAKQNNKIDFHDTN